MSNDIVTLDKYFSPCSPLGVSLIIIVLPLHIDWVMLCQNPMFPQTGAFQAIVQNDNIPYPPYDIHIVVCIMFFLFFLILKTQSTWNEFDIEEEVRRYNYICCTFVQGYVPSTFLSDD